MLIFISPAERGYCSETGVVLRKKGEFALECHWENPLSNLIG